MSDHTVNLRCWEIGGTPAAILVSMTPRSRDANPGGVWIPRSQIEKLSRTKFPNEAWAELSITIPEWLAEKKGLI